MTPLRALSRQVEAGATGELVAVGDGLEVHIYLQAGRLVWGTTTEERFVFRRYLVRAFKIDEQVLLDAIADGVVARRPLGETLVGSGVLSEVQVRAALRAQLLASLTSLARCESSKMLFLPRGSNYARYQQSLTFELNELLPWPDSDDATGGSRVLVVDDDAVMGKQLVAALAAAGAVDAIAVSTGQEVLEIIARHEISVLLCDLKMPEMDGVELIRRLASSRFTGALILVSGAHEKVVTSVRNLAALQGVRVAGQLRKPVEPGLLRALLARARQAGREFLTSDRGDPAADQVRLALRRGELAIRYQPIMSVAGLLPVGVECTALTQNAEGGELKGEASWWVLLEAVLRGAARFFSTGAARPILWNLPPGLLEDLHLPERLQVAAEAHQLKPSDLVLGLSQPELTHEPTTALDVLTRFRLKGLGLSLDDEDGGGAPSLEAVWRLPLTEVRLNAQGVREATQRGGAARARLDLAMDLCRRQGLETVARGVDTQAELTVARALGCTRAQGRLFGEPKELEALLAGLE
jgi:EAL domain-containing protein (putative c-di-GMP-specific phosphodiesterase class I)/CheY-like chemotaxis protein